MSEMGYACKKADGCMVEWVSPAAGSYLAQRMDVWRARGDTWGLVEAETFNDQAAAAANCDHTGELGSSPAKP